MPRPEDPSEWLSRALSDALAEAIPDPATGVGPVTFRMDRKATRRMPSRAAVCAAITALVLGVPAVALAASTLLTRPVAIRTYPSIPAHSSGSYPCPSNTHPPQEFAVPPPPPAANVTTTLAHARSDVNFDVVALTSSAANLRSVHLHDQPAYRFCQVYISGRTDLVLTYDFPWGTTTLTETSDTLDPGGFRAVETPGGGLKKVDVGGQSFLFAFSPSGRVSQVGFATATTNVLLQLASPQASDVVVGLLHRLQILPH